MSRVIVAAALGALSANGCVAPEVCGERLGAEQFSSSTLAGEQDFAAANEEGSVRFRATLRGLSDLWPAEHPVRGASVGVLIRLAYVDAIETGGAATQMPRFAVSLVHPADESGYDFDTPSFPPSTGIGYSIGVFNECYADGDLNCCEYGSPECSVAVELRYRRLDGEPFPPVSFRWEATANAAVDPCPLSAQPEVLLEVEEP
jgi:hypothetical protein